MSKRFLDKERQLLVEVYDTDEIVANPTLDGTEDSLAGLQIGDTKYKVTGGGGGGVDAYELKITDFTPTATEGEYQLSPELIAVVNEYKRPIYVSSQILTIFGLTSIAQMMAYPTSEIPVLGGKHYSSLTLFDTEITGEVGESQTGFSLYQVNGDVYRIIFPQAQTIVKANETLSGGEETLTSLRIGNGLYKVPQGGGETYTAGEGIYIENNVITNSLSNSLIMLMYDDTSISKNNLRVIITSDMLPVYGSIDLAINDDGDSYAVLNLASYEEGPNETTFTYTSNVVDGKYWKLTFTAANLDSSVPCVIEEITVGGGGGSDYTAGDGIQINNDVISVDRAAVQKKLVAGDNIEINPVYEEDPYFEQIGAEDWPDMDGEGVWTDGENIYYSWGSDHYVLDKPTSTWSQKTWNGLTNFNGFNVWTDGENIYVSERSVHYVLDKATSTWSPKTWTGIDLINFNGRNVWTDGENIYFSDDSDHYVLDKTTSTWSPKTWTGLTSFDGNGIWTDGENIYYSNNSDQYVLDRTTSTWGPKTWSGLTSFLGYEVWTDGENIYHSNNTIQYVLDKDTSTWNLKTWRNLTRFNGDNIWTDGENIYYSSLAGSPSIPHGSYILTRDIDPNTEEISFSSSLTEQDIKDLFSEYLDSNASFVEYTDPETSEINYILNIPRNASYEENATGYTLVVDTDDANLDDDTASFGEK